MTNRIFRTFISLVLAIAVGMPPLAASAQDANNPLGLGVGITPEGRWQSETGDSRYDVELCGEDGLSLCGKLIWIRPRDRNERNMPFVGQWVVNEIERTKPAEWQGTLNVYGTEYYGSVKMVSMDELVLTACVLILCESQSYYRRRYADGTRVAVTDPNTDDE